MTGARAFLEIRGLSKTYHAAPVIDGIDCEVARGEVVMLIGPSGAGKSTLLRCVNRIEEPSAGSVLIEGVDMAGEWRDGRLLRDGAKATAHKRRAFGMVFQRFNLFAHLSALDNVAIGPRKVLGWDRAKAEETAVRLLARVRLADHVHKRPRQLSGGQQQRVAIARALAMQPKVMLFDEPTSALDPELVGEVLDVIRDLAREGLTMLIVTHEMRFAREVGDRIVFMADGRIVEQGAAEKMFTAPETNRLREFLSRTRG